METGSNVYLVVGPPGCSKTGWLKEQIARQAEELGPNEIVVTSFTRAAAIEISSRGLPLPDSHVGTLHKLCFHAAGQPKLADTKDGLKIWNETAPEYWKLSGGADIDNPLDSGASSEADGIFAQYGRYRNMLTPRGYWRQDVQDFAKHWEDWKDQMGFMDFTDLLEWAVESLPVCPGVPQIIYVDEAQDLTPLQYKLLKQWAQHVRALVMAGDPDQCIYQFIGASHTLFLDQTVPAENRRLLRQSYTMPQAAHTWSQDWIAQVSDRNEAPYLPTAVEGLVNRQMATYAWPEPLIYDITEMPEGEDMMVLATCNYMLGPLISLLRKQGIPYHNPYRPAAGQWNPLRPARKGSTPTAHRLLSYLRPDEDRWWTGPELVEWTGMLKVTGILERGVESKLKELPERGLTFHELAPLFTEEGLNKAMSLDPRWLLNHVGSAQERSLEYALRIWERYGEAGLKDTPRVKVGTIHSVKGGRADHVAIFPDLSPQGYAEWVGEERDSIVRLFYVGATRTRNTLTFCVPVSARSVEL